MNCSGFAHDTDSTEGAVTRPWWHTTGAEDIGAQRVRLARRCYNEYKALSYRETDGQATLMGIRSSIYALYIYIGRSLVAAQRFARVERDPFTCPDVFTSRSSFERNTVLYSAPM